MLKLLQSIGSYGLPSFAFVFEYRWILLEVLDRVCPGFVNWKQASKPPIKMPFRKVENCNQVIRIGKQLEFSLVNVAGNDIVQGNKKLILGNVLLLYLSVHVLLVSLPFELMQTWNDSYIYSISIYIASIKKKSLNILQSAKDLPFFPLAFNLNFWCLFPWSMSGFLLTVTCVIRFEVKKNLVRNYAIKNEVLWISLNSL